MEPAEEVVEGLGGGDDVEGRGHGAPFLKVRDPQLGTGKFPFCVRFFSEKKLFKVLPTWSEGIWKSYFCEEKQKTDSIFRKV